MELIASAPITLLDTDILIDAGRGHVEAVHYLERIEQDSTMAISVVTQMELVIGCRNKTELREVDRFLQRFQIVSLDKAISDLAVDLLRRYRLSQGLLIADGLIAATAISWGVPLASKNQRDYTFIAGINLLPYP